MEHLIAQIEQNTAATRELIEAMHAQAQAVTTLAGAVHAMADALAACTTEPAPQEEAGGQPSGQQQYDYIDE